MTFPYREAFSRNIGWVTDDEQARLRSARIAIAGLGGVGGVHLLTLARLGIGGFSLADFDTFGVHNFNRQVGASLSTIDQPKIDVMARMALDINPELSLRRFPEGVQPGNIDAFLDGVDLYVDALDFFAFDARQRVFAECHRRRIPAITAAPLGMGAALLNFLPGGMSFDDYFGWGDLPETEKAIRFAVGLAPAMLHRHYLADDRAVDLAARRGPSTAIACQLCAGVVGAEAVKILLGRGPVTCAPVGIQYDAYTGVARRTVRRGGWRHPMTRLLTMIARRRLAAAARAREADAAGG